MKTLKIIFRSCAVVRARGSSTRPFGLDKKTIILKCLKSLLESCKGLEKRISIEIVDDSSGELFLKKIEKILSEYKIKYKIHRMNFGNNGKSLQYVYKIAAKSKEDLIYFCEDDYFHLKHVIPSILDAYDSKVISTSEFGVFPSDYPSYYTNLPLSLIFIGKYNHWRSMARTTGTFIVTKSIFKKFRNVFDSFAEFNINYHGGEKETINKMWSNDVPCIAPIESLVAHLHTTSLPPLVNWDEEINKIKI